MTTSDNKMLNKAARKDYNSIGLALIFQVAFAYGLSLVLYIGILLVFKVESKIVAVYVPTLLQNIVPFIYFYFKHKEKVNPFLKRKRINIAKVLGGASTALWFNIFFSLIVTIISKILATRGVNATEPDFSLGSSVVQNLLLVGFAVVLAPVLEEFVFRGLIYPVMRKHGIRFAIIGSSLFFALFHGNIMQALPASFMGIVLCYLTETTGNIYTSILVHMLNNAVALFMGYLPEYVSGILLLITLPVAIICLVKSRLNWKRFKVSQTLPDGTRWFSFFTSPAIIITFILYFILILLSFKAA